MLEPTRGRPETCLSDRALDMMTAGELAPDARAQAERHLPGCALCSARHRELEAARRAFPLEAPAFAKVVEKVRPPRAPRRRWLFGGAFAAAAAAAVLLSLRAPPPDGGEIRTKGGDKLGFFVDHQGVVREGVPGEVVHPGDRLQPVYTTKEPRHLVIFLRDAKGVTTLVSPREAAVAKLEPGTGVALPYSIRLDGELGVETLLGVFCDRPPPLEALKGHVERGQGARPDGCRVERLSYDKR